MTRSILTPLLLALALPGLTGCGDSKPAAGGNVTMRDMEVVDGTANDSMADLDNNIADGTLLSNMGSSLPVQGTERHSVGNSSDTGTDKMEVGRTGTPPGNASVAE